MADARQAAVGELRDEPLWPLNVQAPDGSQFVVLVARDGSVADLHAAIRQAHAECFDGLVLDAAAAASCAEPRRCARGLAGSWALTMLCFGCM